MDPSWESNYDPTQWKRKERDGDVDEGVLLLSQILELADYVERLLDRSRFVLLQEQEIVEVIESFSGTRLNPRVVELFRAIAQREAFWLDLVSRRLHRHLADNGPYSDMKIPFKTLKRMTPFITMVIDFKSPFAATHTTGVAASAAFLAETYGLPPTDVENMRMAGDLHDIGKLVIPNSILEKESKLTSAEFALVRSHTYVTWDFITAAGAEPPVAEWASFHHETLDGKGYPFHVGAEVLDVGARILAVADVFTALTEDRPYRKGMSKARVIETMDGFVREHHLDGDIFELMLKNYDAMEEATRSKQMRARESYRSFVSAR